jgi:hypothetical protein
MKNLVLCAALVACALGCKSNSNKAVSDPNGANMPKAECNKGACQGACDGQQKASCCEGKKPQG